MKQEIVIKIVKIVLIWVVAFVIARLCSPKRKFFKKMIKNKKLEKVDTTMVRYGTKIINTVVYIIAAYLTITELEYDVSGLVTGLGLSSVVIALAAQDLAKSLIAGASILTDKPYKIGDWLQVDKYEGTVEYINIKSTRIRTMDNSVVIIPNSTMSTTSVINWSDLEKRKYQFNIKLPLTTNKNIIEKIIKRIEFMLQTDEEVLKENLRVNFTKIGDDSLELDILLYTNVIDFDKYLKFKTKINYRIMEIVEEEQIRLSYPGKDIYIHNS